MKFDILCNIILTEANLAPEIYVKIIEEIYENKHNQ